MLCGPETDTRILYGAIKTNDTDARNEVHIKLYNRARDIIQYTVSFDAALDFDGTAIGCEMTVLALNENDTCPMAAPNIPTRSCEHTSIQHCSPGMNRRRYNLYVGLLIESEARVKTQSAAMRLEEDTLLSQLFAMASV